MRDRDQPRQFWLQGDLGRVLIRHGGLLLGRSTDCEVVLPDSRVSRHQLLLRPVDDGVELMVLGRAPVRVNDAPVQTVATLRDGDGLAVSGRVFRVVSTPAPRVARADCVWGVESAAGAFYRIAESPFTVGGDERDDLHVAGWAPATLTLSMVQRALVMETGPAGVDCDGPLQAAAVVAVRSGAVVRYLGQSLRLVSASAGTETATAPESGVELPRAARLEFLPRGGRLTVGYGSWERTLWLADRRCDLVATLLFPPAPYAAGDLVPDDVLIPRVWPGGRQGGRVELNTLVFRTRKDLVRADIDGGALLDRYDGGVRFRLADGADVAMVPQG